MHRGSERLRRGNYAGAIQSFRYALRLDPANLEAKRRLEDAEFELNYQRALGDEKKGDPLRAQINLNRAAKYVASPQLEMRVRAERAQLTLDIQKADLRLKWLQELQSAFQRVNHLMDAGDWRSANQAIFNLAGVVDQVQRSEPDLWKEFASQPLWNDYVSYARGGLRQPSQMAPRWEGIPSAYRVAEFQKFLVSQQRAVFLKRWTPRCAGVYLGVLLLSLYMGIKRDRSE